MKLLLILLATLAIAKTTNFKEVNHNGKTLKPQARLKGYK